MEALRPADVAAVKDSLLTKESMKAAHSKVAKMRENCPGAMKFATFAMMDPTFHKELEQITFATKPWRHLHGRWQKDLTSVDGALTFHREMVGRTGPFWDTVVQSMRPYAALHFE